jgi:DNA-binding response OmpR family regulator
VHVLLVEDDERIGEPLVDALRSKGHAIRWVRAGFAALDQKNGFDVVLLDLGLPDVDGRVVCRALRQRHPELPIIVVTARGEEDDRVGGLDDGADDYLVKPFGLRELEARMRAVRRRVHPHDEAEETGVQTLGRLVIDRDAHRVVVDGAEIALTPKEFDLLALLAERPGAVVNRQTVVETVWNPHPYGTTKTLDVHVASLRRKLGHPDWIETVRGVGLRLGSTTADCGDAS